MDMTWLTEISRIAVYLTWKSLVEYVDALSPAQKKWWDTGKAYQGGINES